ncbi:hypothetical protein FRB91_005619 [Serendipita sp. 411]|nr:hypothetical protein FRB91_005619 [Serendipita sp. 411]
MPNFKLLINIDPGKLADPKSRGQALCIAKSWNHSSVYNSGTKLVVVGMRKSEQLAQNTFEWNNDNKLLTTLRDVTNIPKEMHNKYQRIDYGQTLVVPDDGDLSDAQVDPNPHSRELVLHNKGLDWTDAFVASSLTINGTSYPDLPLYMGRAFKQEILDS